MCRPPSQRSTGTDFGSDCFRIVVASKLLAFWVKMSFSHLVYEHAVGTGLFLFIRKPEEYAGNYSENACSFATATPLWG